MVFASDARIAGYLVGDDCSSRSIEGENPLYLPQAKSYDDCVALSPSIALARDIAGPPFEITMTISRGAEVVFDGSTSTDQMRRRVEELGEYLFREMTFPHGVVLLTGTGISPPGRLLPGGRGHGRDHHPLRRPPRARLLPARILKRPSATAVACQEAGYCPGVPSLQDEVDRVAEEHAFSGVVRVDRSGEIELARAYGFAHRSLEIPNTVDTQHARHGQRGQGAHGAHGRLARRGRPARSR